MSVTSKEIDDLKVAFEKAGHKPLFSSLYMTKINESFLSKLPYNRKATPYLAAYFMAAVLDRAGELQNPAFKDELMAAFYLAAEEMGGGNDGTFNIFTTLITRKNIDLAIDKHFEDLPPCHDDITAHAA